MSCDCLVWKLHNLDQILHSLFSTSSMTSYPLADYSVLISSTNEYYMTSIVKSGKIICLVRSLNSIYANCESLMTFDLRTK